jgi:multiple sugar transport system substrate-binding protein
MKRVLGAILLVAGLVSASLFGKETIEVAVYPDLDKAYITLLSNFMKDNPDIIVKMRVNGYGDHHSALTTQIASGSGAPDVAAIEIGFLGQLGAGGGFENLLDAPYNAAKYKKDTIRFAWVQASTDPKTLVAMPVDIGPGCMFYRVDILKKFGIDYRSIKDMDTLFAVGKKVTKDMNGDGKPDQWLIGDDGDIFNIIIRADSTRYFDAKGNPVLNRPLVRAAAVWQKKFHDAGLSGKIGAWSPEWYAALSAAPGNGAVVCQPSGAWLAGHLQNWMATNQYGNWRAANMPALKKGNKPMYVSWGGSFLAIPKSSKHKAAAWKFIEYMTTRVDTQIESFKRSNTFPTWLPAWKDPTFVKPVGYLGNQDARALWMDIAKKIPDVFINEKDAVAANILAAHVSEVVLHGKNVDQALKDAQAEIEKQLKK